MHYDSNFLKELDHYPHKVTHIKLTALDLNDIPVERIEGVATGGSITVDGKSSMQRTCQISLVSDGTHPFTEAYWALKNKIKLEVGLENYIDNSYPPIIWFEMGVYFIKSFGKTEQANGQIQINLQGQDKMSKLNGQLGGVLTAELNATVVDITDKGRFSHTAQIELKDAIFDLVCREGRERPENIIIQDLDDGGWELWEYKGNKPLYYIYKPGEAGAKGQIIQMTNDQKTSVKIVDGGWVNISEIPNYRLMQDLMTSSSSGNEPTKIKYGSINCEVIKIDPKQTAGYRPIPLYYNDKAGLIGAVGTTIDNLIDKIKQMLGDFEYFYNLQGRFVFRKKKTYVNELFSPINGELGIQPTMTVSPYAYEFEDKSLFTSYSAPPNIENIKNDFAVWGERVGVSGVKLPIHARCAIDKKPTTYTSPVWEENTPQITYSTDDYDWRELIYQMASDYNKYNTKDKNFINKISDANQWIKDNGGMTGYEQYYTDLLGFWRQLYNPNGGLEFYPSSAGDKKYWNKDVFENPKSIFFWFDFLEADPSTPLGKCSVREIGQRAKAENNSSCTSIYNAPTPEVQFVVMSDPRLDDSMDFTPIFIQDSITSSFAKSAQGLSCIEKINELIFNHCNFAETLQITSIPIYYLQPNTRIRVLGQDYILNSISYNLTNGGTMNISGTKIEERLF